MSVAARAGFINAGQTCFVGSALQLLLHVEPLNDILARHAGAGPITTALALLSVQHKSQRVVDPSPLLREVYGFDHDRFHLGEQQDAIEFLDWLMHIATTECPEFANLFETHLAERVVCMNCGLPSSEHVTTTAYFTLHNPENSTLIYRLAKYFEDGSLTSHCKQCHAETRKTCTRSVIKPSQYIFINVARFQPSVRGVPAKSCAKLVMNDSIDVQGSKYKLKAFLVHVGSSISNGHYIAVCNLFGEWLQYSDELVTQVTHIDDDFYERNNYVLLYELQETAAVCTPSKNGQNLWNASPLTDNKESPRKSGRARRKLVYNDDTKTSNTSQDASRGKISPIQGLLLTAPAKEKSPVTSYEVCVLGDPTDFRYFTGLTPEQFSVLYEFLGGDDLCARLKYTLDGKTPLRIRAKKVSLRGRLFLVLVRMRRDLSLRDIAYVLGISVTVAGVIFYTWVRLLAVTIKDFEEVMAVSAEKQNRDKPMCFAPYKNLRMIIDCAEFPIERSSNMQQQANTFSDYKHGNTGKVLIGISCYGGVSFVSECFEGRMTDQEVVQKSGLLNILKKSDVVMADRGFRIEEEMKRLGCTLIKPPDKQRGKKGEEGFTSRAEVATKSVASVRIYVEHTIGRIKDWAILANRVEFLLLPYLGDLILIAAFMHNFSRCYIGRSKK